MDTPTIIATPEQTHAESVPLFGGARGTAIKILNRINRSDAYLDRLIDSELRGDGLNDLDKGFMHEIVTGVVRWQMKLDWVLTGFFHGNFTKAETNIKNALRVALYQILFLSRVPHSAAVNEAVEFIKRLRGKKAGDLVNAVLRNIIRNIDNIRYPEPAEDKVRYLSVIESHPVWMTRRWMDRFGFDGARALMAANNKIPDLALRANTLKITTDEFCALLSQHQIEHTKSSIVDGYIKVRHLAGIGSSELFAKGFFTVQDESAALPVRLLQPVPGERVLDLCAAPGGKATYIGQCMRNDGTIIAVDRYETRLNLVTKASNRLGLTNIQTIPADAATFETEPADKVLVDAPCSGLGTLSKKPDAKWNRARGDIDDLSILQAAILNNAARLVKPGGVLVYSTCTTEPEENAMQTRAFLDRHPGFAVESASAFVPSSVVNGDGCVETFPHIHAMDGSYAVRFRRSA